MSNKESLQCLLNNQGYAHFPDGTYDEFATFLFLTSWYEEALFNETKPQNPKNSRDLCNTMFPVVDMNKFGEFGDHFSNRYLQKEAGKIICTSKFNKLQLSKSWKPVVFESLKSYVSGITDETLLFSYLQIAYRFRNNMFHGNKGLDRVQSYIREFEVINRFLLELMEQILDAKFKGYNG